MAFDVVREPMFLLLIAAGSIYPISPISRKPWLYLLLVMWDHLHDEHNTERALEALCDVRVGEPLSRQMVCRRASPADTSCEVIESRCAGRSRPGRCRD